MNETTKKLYEYVNLIGKLKIYWTDFQLVIATPAMSSQNFCAIDASDSKIWLLKKNFIPIPIIVYFKESDRLHTFETSYNIIHSVSYITGDCNLDNNQRYSISCIIT